MKVQYIPIYDIFYDPKKTIRFEDDEDKGSLANNIENYGLLHPLTVRKIGEKRYEIIAGVRRYQALRMVGVDRVPCIVKQVNNDETYILKLVENIQRKELSPYETVKALEELRRQHPAFSLKYIAEMINKSVDWIRQKYKYKKVYEELVDEVGDDIELLPEGHLTRLGALPTADKVEIVKKSIEAIKQGKKISQRDVTTMKLRKVGRLKINEEVVTKSVIDKGNKFGYILQGSTKIILVFKNSTDRNKFTESLKKLGGGRLKDLERKLRDKGELV